MSLVNITNLTLLVALALSTVAAYYSIVGLTAIFAGAVVPIIIMGTILEITKITATIWLRKYWSRAGITIKLYLVPAVVLLAFLTSMGIFGFLSKAHTDQNLVGSDVIAKVSLLDEKIKTLKENIDANRRTLNQLNEAVDQVMARSTSEAGADKATALRRSQSKERTRLLQEIEAYHKELRTLNEERAPLAVEIRKVEAEVGPIKYIAAMIYGDNPDANLLESAVRWVIVLIVIVFDPLAIVLVLSANASKEWDKETSIPVQQNYIEKEPEKSEKPIEEKIEEPNQLEQEKDIDVEPTPIVVQETEIPALEKVKVTPVIKTEGVTEQPCHIVPGSDYVEKNGKQMHKEVFVSLHPDLKVRVDELGKPRADFGTQFPKYAFKGDIFVRVDIVPNRIFKFNGTTWVEINQATELTEIEKTLTDKL